METSTPANKTRRHRRFLLGVLLMLTLCAGVWLAGRAYGNREGTARAKSMFPERLPVSTKTYYVGDFVIESSSETTPQVDFEGLRAKIEQKCSPDTWMNEGGPGRISPFPLNSTLIVAADNVVHSQIEALLARMRKKKFGPDYKVQPPPIAGLTQKQRVANE